MPDDAIESSELKIKERAEPPAFGLWLSLLAVGLTLGAIQAIAVLARSSITSVDFLAQLAISAWALVNLILLLKRRRAFINSMLAFLAVNALLLLAATVIGATAAVSSPALLRPLAGLAMSVVWIVYLLRSRHARQVLVR